MRTIELDASNWRTPLDFVSALKAALGAPEWHGSNVAAFVDSMVAGGINALKPPYVIRVVNATKLAPEVMDLIRAVSSAVERTRLPRFARTGEDVAVSLAIGT